MAMRIYVGTYRKYNSGSIAGKWFDLEDYACKQDFEEACQEFHGPGEHEFMFQDHEGIPPCLIGESYVDPAVWELMDFDGDMDAALAYCNCFDKWDEDDFNDRYRGEYESWRTLAEEILDDTGQLGEIPESLRYYFDYEAYGRDLRLSGDIVEQDGYYFWGN